MQNTYSWLGLGVAIAVLLVGGIFFINKKNGGVGTVSTTTPSTASTTTTDLGNGVSVTGNGTVEQVPLSNTVPAPALSDTIIITNTSLSAEAQTMLRNNETALIAQIRKDPNIPSLWLKLGVYRKMGGDYAGAITAWNYVAAAAPKSSSYVAYANLGDLYMNFVVDYPKAEANYKAAIAIKPTVIDYYRNLFTLYTSFYKTNQGQANAIVAQGLKANPGNADLLALQAQLKSSTQ